MDLFNKHLGIDGAVGSCETWGTTPAGWITDYVILGASLLTCCGAAQGKDTMLSQLYVAFALTTGIAYGAGGVAHMMLWLYELEGEDCGSKWGAPNYEWMYAWIFAMGFAPFSVAGLTAMAFNATSCGGECLVGILGTYLVAFVFAVYESYMFANLQLENSGVAGAIFSMSFLSLTIVLVIVGAICKRSCSRGLTFLASSALSYLAGILVLQFLPGKLPAAFNHNAFFHVFVVISMFFAYCALNALLAARDVLPLMDSSMVSLNDGNSGRGAYVNDSFGQGESTRLVYASQPPPQSQQEPVNDEMCCWCWGGGSKNKQQADQDWTYKTP